MPSRARPDDARQPLAWLLLNLQRGIKNLPDTTYNGTDATRTTQTAADPDPGGLGARATVAHDVC
jgi:hypothetical protein